MSTYGSSRLPDCLGQDGAHCLCHHSVNRTNIDSLERATLNFHFSLVNTEGAMAKGQSDHAQTPISHSNASAEDGDDGFGRFQRYARNRTAGPNGCAAPIVLCEGSGTLQ